MKAALVLILDVDETEFGSLRPAVEAIQQAEIHGKRHLHAFIREDAEGLLSTLPDCCQAIQNQIEEPK